MQRSEGDSGRVGRLQLRPVAPEDLPTFFENQRDPVAVRMAAFTAKDPEDWNAFLAHWKRILSDPKTENRTILWEGRVAGSIAKFEMDGKPNLTYWVGREFWGQGVATHALQDFLGSIAERPLYASTAHDNAGSIRVLEKCGFVRSGSGRGYAPARGEDIEETFFILAAGASDAGNL